MTFRDQLAAADLRLSARLHLADRSGPRRAAAMALAHSGDSPLWLAGLLLTAWLGTPFWQRVAWLDLIGIAVTAALVQLIKFLVRRPRPAGDWGQGYRKVDPHSFPSGHAARAALLAALAVVMGPPWWAALLLAWAPLVSLSRVAMRLHYLSDVVAGAAIGVACGAAVAVFLAR